MSSSDWCDDELNGEIASSRRILFALTQKRLDESPKIELYADEVKEGKGKFLIDTGAELSIISLKKLKPQACLNQKLKYILSGIGGKCATTLGEINLKINGTLCAFQVVPDELSIPVDGIVRMPFLKHGSIDLKRKVINHPLGIFPFLIILKIQPYALTQERKN